MRIQWKKLVISVLLPLLSGAVAAFLTRNNMNIYETLNKPFLTPPDWVFPIVWTILYILMGIAAYIVSESKQERLRNYALSIYSIQLIFNFFWSIIFFNLSQFFIAFVWLVMLWLLILYTLLLFNEIERSAAILIAPYLLWVTFAGYLNLVIVLIN